MAEPEDQGHIQVSPRGLNRYRQAPSTKEDIQNLLVDIKKLLATDMAILRAGGQCQSQGLREGHCRAQRRRFFPQNITTHPEGPNNRPSPYTMQPLTSSP
ncbi:Hypothetical predicted protein, partial [Pelobates cultripes]